MDKSKQIFPVGDKNSQNAAEIEQAPLVPTSEGQIGGTSDASTIILREITREFHPNGVIFKETIKELSNQKTSTDVSVTQKKEDPNTTKIREYEKTFREFIRQIPILKNLF